MSQIVQGVIRGKTIELQADPGMANGRTIEVTIRSLPGLDPNAQRTGVPRTAGGARPPPPKRTGTPSTQSSVSGKGRGVIAECRNELLARHKHHL